MPNARLLTLAVFLVLCGPHSTLVADNTTLPAQAANEDNTELRRLADRFYHSMESGDETEFLKLWSAQSPDNELQRYAKTYVLSRVERLNILEVRIDADRATVHVQVDLQRLAHPPQAPALRGFVHWWELQTLRCIREGPTWKVFELVNRVDDFANELVNADSKEARNALLVAHPEIDLHWVSNSLVVVAESLKEDDFEKWLVIYQLAAKIATQVGSKDQAAAILNELAVAFGTRGDNARSLEYYLKSIAINEQMDPRERATNSFVWANLGTIYSDQGNYAQALASYQRAMNPLKPAPWVLRNIAQAYMKMGDYTQALEYFNKSLTLSEHLDPGSGRDGETAGSLAGIGRVYLAQGNYSQALDSFGRALQIAETSQRPDNAGEIPSFLNSIAKTYLLQGNVTRAVEFIERALAIPRKVTAVPGTDVEILSTAGRAYRESGMNVRARAVLDRAITGIEYRRNHTAGGEQNRQLHFEQLVTSYHEMIKLLVTEKNSDQAFAFAERSKARALLDVLKSGRVEINKALTADEQKLDLDLRRRITTLNRELESTKRDPQSDQTRINSVESGLQQARLEYESFQTNLYVLHPESLPVSRGELKPINVDETSELFANSNTTLLEYVVTDERTYLFVITKTDLSSQPSLKLYPIEIKQKELEDRIERYRNQLAQRDPEFQRTARELYVLLLSPAQLRDSNSLIIVPDGVLWDLPFQALQSEKQRYVIEDHTIFYAASLTALREMMKEGRKRSGKNAARLDLLAFGNPVNGEKVQERIRTGLMGYALEPLPEAEKQVVELSRLYGSTKSKAYTGASATEDRVKTEGPVSRVIQFATHGILNSGSPMYSHLVLSQGKDTDNEDGLLEAWEIMKLDLHADMVVLAACETARGRVGAGEGMIGMSWAFFVAGSPTTVASQWKVESASTTQLMLEFHRNLRARNPAVRLSKAKALQLAAVKLMKKPEYRHPFYWAGFVLVGDGY